MDGVVDVDSYIEDQQTKYQFEIDKEKAALNGVSTEQAAAILSIAIAGLNVGLADSCPFGIAWQKQGN